VAAKQDRTTARVRRLAEESGDVVPITPHHVPAVMKAIAVVRFLNERGGVGATLSEIADALAITRSHCHNILRTLATSSWVAYERETRRYRLSSRIAADTSAALVSQPYLAVVRPAMQRLADAVGVPCTVCEPLADGSFLVVHTANYPDPFISAAPVGYRFPSTAAPQFKAALSWLPATAQTAAVDAWVPVRHTKSSIMTRDALVRDLAEARARGFVRSVGEYVDGFTTVALPVFDRAGEVVLTVSCAGRSDGFAQREAALAAQLIACVNAIHSAIDGRPPVDFPRP